MGKQKVAITVQQASGIESVLDPRFGRAPVFLIVDKESNEVLAEIENAAVNAAHGAGTGAAAIMSDNNVDAVISGRFGPKAHQALEALGIEMWIAPNGIKAADALQKLASNDLEKSELTRY